MHMTFIFLISLACYNYLPSHALEKALQQTAATFTTLANSLKKQIIPRYSTGTDDLHVQLNGCTIHIQTGDITKIKTDAIVNAANQSLMKNPGGVAGAIWRAAGADKINAAIDKAKQDKKIPESLEIGELVVTDAFDLSAHGVRYILHTPGPDCRSGEDIDLLYNCYQNCLLQADTLKLQSIAFPAISIGIFGCDIVTSARLVAKALYKTTEKLKYVKEIYLLTNVPEYEQALVMALQGWLI